MMVTITRLYDDYASASQAVMDLEAAGVPSKDISLIASNAGNWYDAKTTKKKPKIDRDHDGVDDRVEGAEAGAGIGAVLAGGAAGGIIGALTQGGMTEEEAQVYVEGVRRGGTLLSARVPSEQRGRYEAILNRSAVNISDRGEMYRNNGWSGYDPEAPPYTAEQIRRERDTNIGRLP